MDSRGFSSSTASSQYDLHPQTQQYNPFYNHNDSTVFHIQSQSSSYPSGFIEASTLQNGQNSTYLSSYLNRPEEHPRNFFENTYLGREHARDLLNFIGPISPEPLEETRNFENSALMGIEVCPVAPQNLQLSVGGNGDANDLFNEDPDSPINLAKTREPTRSSTAFRSLPGYLKQRSRYRKFDCFEYCKLKRYSERGFTRRSNLLVHLRNCHHQDIPARG